MDEKLEIMQKYYENNDFEAIEDFARTLSPKESHDILLKICMSCPHNDIVDFHYCQDSCQHSFAKYLIEPAIEYSEDSLYN